MKAALFALMIASIMFMLAAVSIGLSILGLFFAYIGGITTGILIWELTREEEKE